MRAGFRAAIIRGADDYSYHGPAARNPYQGRLNGCWAWGCERKRKGDSHAQMLREYKRRGYDTD